MSLFRLLAVAAALVLCATAHAELQVETPSETIPGETITIVDSEGCGGALLVTYYPGSRIEQTSELQPAAEQPDGQGVRYAFVPDRSGLVRLTAAESSTTIMVGYPRAPRMGIVMLIVAILSLGGLSAVGLRNA